MKKWILAIIAALYISTVSVTAFAAENPNDPSTWEPTLPMFEFATRIHVYLEAPRVNVGKVSELGDRRIVPITGGRMEGPLLKGEVLNLGADFQVAKQDGTFIAVEAKYVLKTDDGALIYLSTRGMKVTSPEVVALKKAVPPSSYYFRQCIFFETASPKYAWLNKTLAIGTLQSSFGANSIVHDVYLVR